MTEMFGEAWSPMSVPDLAPDDDDDIFFNETLTEFGSGNKNFAAVWHGAI